MLENFCEKVIVKIVFLLVRIETPFSQLCLPKLFCTIGCYWFVKISLTEGWFLFLCLLADGPSNYLLSVHAVNVWCPLAPPIGAEFQNWSV